MNARTTSLLVLAIFVGLAGLGWAGFPRFAFALLALAIAAAIAIERTLARRVADRPAIAQLEAARALLEAGDSYAALRTASAAVSQATTARTRHAALTTLAWAALAQGYPRRAKAALDQIQAGRAPDLHLYAAVQAANGDAAAAIRSLDVSGMLGMLNREGAMLLIDLHGQQGRFDRAAAVAVESREVLGAERCRTVLRAAWAAGEYAPAAKLASGLFRMTGATEDAAALLSALAQVPDGVEVSRTLDDLVGRLRRVDGIAQARSLFTKLRADGSLSSAARAALERMLRRIEAVH